MFRRYLNKPEYLWQPSAVVRRLCRRCRPLATEAERRLPWGLTLRYRLDDVIGGAIDRMGVYDLALSEALWRLLDPGETAYDVGANIGYTASLMAARVGRSGVIHAFEPHPAVFAELDRNVGGWRGTLAADLHAHRLAISDVSGEASLTVPAAFEHNRGTAALEVGCTESGVGAHRVDVATLDSFAGRHGVPRVVKVDVEGHELAVFRGAIGILSSKQVRDVIFEEHGMLPTPTTALLESLGYNLFVFRKGLFGPSLAPTTMSSVPTNGFDPTNLIATRDSARVRRRFARRGWQVLRPPRS